jgi:hypothetical protein
MLSERKQKEVAEQVGLVYAGKDKYGNLEFIGADKKWKAFEDAKDQVCEFCEGTGLVSVDESDGEGHMMRGVGTEKCICQLEEFN